MNPDDLARILDELGQRLGPTGEYVFALAVRQVVIDATIGLLWAVPVSLVTLALTVWGVRWTRRSYAAAKEAPKDQYSSGVDVMDYIFPWIFVGFAILLALSASAMVAGSALSRLLNPEYAALRDILSTIGAGR